MRVVKFASLAVIAVAISACTSVSPIATLSLSTLVTPLPSASLPPSVVIPSEPESSLAAASVPPSDAPTIPPESISTTPEVTPPPTPKPTKKPTPTPKPTKKPTPTPSLTPTSISADLEVSFDSSTIPNPWYNNMDYTIRVFIDALGTQDVSNARITLVAKDEGVSFEFDTGPIATTDNYYHDLVVNLPAIGPSALILTATLPEGYADTNKSNNSKTVPIDVSYHAP